MHKVSRSGCADHGIARSFDRIQRKSIRPKKKVEYLRRPERGALGNRDVAQLVEYASGGRVVAGSSPVIPTPKPGAGASGFLHRAIADHGLCF